MRNLARSSQFVFRCREPEAYNPEWVAGGGHEERGVRPWRVFDLTARFAALVPNLRFDAVGHHSALGVSPSLVDR
jgi:hypothetical protein